MTDERVCVHSIPSEGIRRGRKSLNGTPAGDVVGTDPVVDTPPGDTEDGTDVDGYVDIGRNKISTV